MKTTGKNHEFIQCEFCDAKCKNHKWGQIKAKDAGWFFSRSANKVFCPKHVPQWVRDWRANKESKKHGNDH